LECDGLFYPNLFTLYVDSTANETYGVDYYSLPLRIFVTGEQCEKDDPESGELNRIHVKVSEAKRLV
jgi:cadherin EGF LAG seven-pass G-type receptor 1